MFLRLIFTTCLIECGNKQGITCLSAILFGCYQIIFVHWFVTQVIPAQQQVLWLANAMSAQWVNKLRNIDYRCGQYLNSCTHSNGQNGTNTATGLLLVESVQTIKTSGYCFYCFMQCLEDSSGAGTIGKSSSYYISQSLKFEENPLKHILNHSDNMSVSCEAIGEVETPHSLTWIWCSLKICSLLQKWEASRLSGSAFLSRGVAWGSALTRVGSSPTLHRWGLWKQSRRATTCLLKENVFSKQSTVKVAAIVTDPVNDPQYPGVLERIETIGVFKVWTFLFAFIALQHGTQTGRAQLDLLHPYQIKYLYRIDGFVLKLHLMMTLTQYVQTGLIQLNCKNTPSYIRF